MCGIWAIFGDTECANKNCNAYFKIQHRGPDSFRLENVLELKNCRLGFHRLAINDLSDSGMQPIRLNTFPDLWVLMNGECYNSSMLGKEHGFKYQTSMDTETLLHLYTKKGMDYCVKSVDGDFAFCIVDVKTREVHIARDLLGIRPLYRLFSDDPNFLAVSSEMKGLTHIWKKHGGNIEQFPPGHYATYSLDEGGRPSLVKQVQYYKIGDPPLYKTPVPKLGKNIFGNIRTLLTAAVKKRLVSSARPIGCFLSGGVDSSLIAALTVKLAKEKKFPYKIKTFAIGLEGSPDLHFAKKVADFIGSDHFEKKITARECVKALKDTIWIMESYDPYIVRSGVCSYLLGKFISENSDVIVTMSGEGSSEVTQGYLYFKNAPNSEAAHIESVRLLNSAYTLSLQRSEKLTAASGLEMRFPFLDQQFLAYYLSMEQNIRQPQDGIEKYLLRRSFRDEALLPTEVLWRPADEMADGISPQKKSMLETLYKYLNSKVSDEDLDDAKSRYPYNTPTTKEEYRYREIYERCYPGQEKQVPEIFRPKWTDVQDPSARKLANYRYSMLAYDNISGEKIEAEE